MDNLGAFLPRDRFQALARGSGELPARAEGAALFADISGFTPLVGAFTRWLGPLRGAEEITRTLDAIYTALISRLDDYRGSVITFSGDAITCWFEGDDGRRALASALAMQEAMRAFSSLPVGRGDTIELSIKVGIVAGPVRRFLVGDPGIQRLDVVAGETVDRVAAAQAAAKRGEVVLDAITAEALGDGLVLVDRREPPAFSERFVVAAGHRDAVHPDPWPSETAGTVDDARLHEWLLRPVLARLREHGGRFLSEIRPVVALFIRFDGIDYDADPDAGRKLDQFILWVQRTLATYEGILLEIITGDKGSHILAIFGAPVAHEDDVWRALTAALVLRTPPSHCDFITAVRIGISRGPVRTGTFGGPTRRSYGVQGDEVIVAARLMQRTEPGEVLVSGVVHGVVPDRFNWRPLLPLDLKGKLEPVPVYVLLSAARRPTHHYGPSSYALPLVGRESELARGRSLLESALKHAGGILGLEGEAGVGKSRLIAEILGLARPMSFTVLAGGCSAYATNASYYAWTSVWQEFFDLEPDGPSEAQIRRLEAKLGALNPDLVPRLPLLGSVTRLSIPDNDLTRSFDAKLRKSSLETLLADCVRLRARSEPLLLILEDIHWLDPLSRDLLEVVARAAADLPVAILLACRPRVETGEGLPAWESLPGFTRMTLHSFSGADARTLIQAKWTHMFGASRAPTERVIQRFTDLAEGNPFYLEELLNYVQDRGISPDDPQALESLELPTNLHSLILSRIDQLTDSQRVTIKVASAIGRVFRADVLWGAYPELGSQDVVRSDLDALQRLEVMAHSSAEQELVYLFKHVVTQEVAYESLASETRAMLHDRIGGFIETSHRDELDQHLDLLAFHFDRSLNLAKKRHYLHQAGRAAQGRYANSGALDYYRRLLPLLAHPEHTQVLLNQGEVLELLGRWKDAAQNYQSALGAAREHADPALEARCQAAVGELYRKQANYPEAARWLESARARFMSLGDQVGTAQVLHHVGNLDAQRGDHVGARQSYLASLEIRRRLDDKIRIGSLLSNLAILAHQYTRDHAEAKRLHEESLAIRRQTRDRWAVANSLNNLGVLLHDDGELGRARELLEESVQLYRQIGDPWCIANSLSSLAAVTLDQRDFAATGRLLRESLEINRSLGEPRGIAFLLEYCGKLAALQALPLRALTLTHAAHSLRENLGAPLSPEELEQQQLLLDAVTQGLSSAEHDRALQQGRSMSIESAADYALAGLEHAIQS